MSDTIEMLDEMLDELKIARQTIDEARSIAGRKDI